MARRLKSTGSIYRRGSDGRWMGSVETVKGERKRRTVSSTMFCRTLTRLAELDPAHHAEITSDPDRRTRAAHMEAARKLGTHTQAEWFAYLRQVGNVCEYCGHPCNPTKDHRQPVSRGGSDAIENIAVACFRCNSTKNNATEDEFRAHLQAVGELAPGREKARARRTGRTRPDVDMTKVHESPARRAAREKAAEVYPITVDDLDNWSCACGAGPTTPNFPGRAYPTTRRNAYAAAARHTRSHIRKILQETK